MLSCTILASALPLQAFTHADTDYEHEIGASHKPFWTKQKKIAAVIAGALAIVTPFGIYYIFFKSPKKSLSSNNGTNRLQPDKGAALKLQSLRNESQPKQTPSLATPKEIEDEIGKLPDFSGLNKDQLTQYRQKVESLMESNAAIDTKGPEEFKAKNRRFEQLMQKRFAGNQRYDDLNKNALSTQMSQASLVESAVQRKNFKEAEEYVDEARNALAQMSDPEAQKKLDQMICQAEEAIKQGRQDLLGSLQASVGVALEGEDTLQLENKLSPQITQLSPEQQAEINQKIEQKRQKALDNQRSSFDTFCQQLEEPLPAQGSASVYRALSNKTLLNPTDVYQLSADQQNTLEKKAKERRQLIEDTIGKKQNENTKKLIDLLKKNSFSLADCKAEEELITQGFVEPNDCLRDFIQDKQLFNNLKPKLNGENAVQFLIKHGASLYEKPRDGSGVCYAEIIAQVDNVQFTKILINWLKEKRGGIDAEFYNDGATELHSIAYNSPGVESLELFLQEKANPNAVIAHTSGWGVGKNCTPLHLVIKGFEYGRYDIDVAIKKIEVLRKYKKDAPSFTNGGTIESPLAYATRMNVDQRIIDALTK